MSWEKVKGDNLKMTFVAPKFQMHNLFSSPSCLDVTAFKWICGVSGRFRREGSVGYL